MEAFENIDEEPVNEAMIYFAVEDGIPLAACMTKPMGNGTWEICKMGSNKHKPHKGCGSAVFGAVMQWAISHGARKIFILSNSKLKALDDYEYIRGDIAFERIIE